MSYTLENWRTAITNLIKKTSKKEIAWELSELFQSDVWTEVDRSFKCTIKDKTYVVSTTRKRHYTDEEEYFWVNGFDFSIFITEHLEYVRLASAPEGLNIIESLYSTAESSFAFSTNALGDLLG